MESVVFKDEVLEAAARDAVRLDESRALLDKFITLIRESGTADEETAGRYLVEPAGRARRARHPAHAGALHQQSRARRAVDRHGRRHAHVARAAAGHGPQHRRRCRSRARSVTCRRSTPAARRRSSTCRTPPAAAVSDDPVRGRIVLTEGFSMPASVGAFERRGAIGQIYIHPGKNVHEGICTSIWGAPTAESIGRKPAVPVVCINNPDGQALIADLETGPVRASLKTWLREGWMTCLLPVVEIRGQRGPRRVPARARPLRLVVRGHRRQRHGRCGAARTGARAVGDARSAEAHRAHRVVAGPFHRPLRRLDVVRRHLRRRDRRALHRAARHRLTGLRGRNRLRGSDVDGRGRRLVPQLDPRRAGRDVAARAPAARRRLLVQPDRPDRPLHAALEHPHRGAQAPRLLRGGRLRREHRLAHARRPDAGRGSRDPAPRSVRLPHHHRAHPQRAAAPVRLRRGHRRDAAAVASYHQAAGGAVDFAPLLADMEALSGADHAPGRIEPRRRWPAARAPASAGR